MKAGLKLSFLFFLLLLHLAPADGQQIYFHKVLPPEGKTFEHVTGIVQDGQGFMWFATKRGLFRYDGFQMQSYKHNPLDINSLASDALEVIAVDQQGMLWIGTAGAGLDRYDPSTRTFTHFRHTDSDTSSLSLDWVSAVLVDKDGVLWVGTGNGLNRDDSRTGRFTHYRNNPGDSTTISGDEIGTIYEDRYGLIWIGTGSVYGQDKSKKDVGGLNKFDKKSNTFIRYKSDPKDPQSLVNNKVSAITEDSKGNLWVGTAGDGLHTMDRSRGLFERHRYDPVHPDKLSRPPLNKIFAPYDHITFIKEDPSGAIWIGTSESGINYYNPATGKITHYESNGNSAGSFMDRTAWTAYVSREGVLWISSLSGALYRVSPGQKNIPFYQSGNRAINTFYQDEDGTFWLGTEDGGLIQDDGANNVIQRFVHEQANPHSIANNSVVAIIKDRQDNMWVGTHGGLELFNKKKKTFLHFRHNPKNNSTLSSDYVFALYKDSKARVWIGTSRGLDRLDRTTGLFKRHIFYPEDTSFFGSGAISSILEDHSGEIWAAGGLGGGIHRINPETGKSKTYLFGITLVGIFEDSSNTIRAGGNNFYYFDRSLDTFYTYADRVSTVEITNIRSVMGDKHGNFWIAKPDGILKIDENRHESTLYGRNYGLDGSGLVYGSCYESSEGKLYFGHDNGYYSFFDDSLGIGIQPPLIVISNLRLANQLVKLNPKGVLPKPLAEIKKIVLNHNQNVFSFDYAVIDYTNPEENRQLFMLENYDNEWHQTGAEHRAYYFNVPPGKYTFHIKGANSYGIWAEKSIDVNIMPPWWRTWWANTIFVVLAFAVLWGVMHYRSRKLRRENRLLEDKVTHRTRQLQQSFNELKSTQAQLIQSEKMASLGELTAGIAHEIQNPLNFVNNFSEVNTELLSELKNEMNKGNIDDANAIARYLIENNEKINHHGKRADAIVKNMLQHSGSSSSQKEPTDINKLADEYLRMSYHGIRAKDKSFNAALKTDFDKTIGKINIIPQDIGRVLLNLYNNAFYAAAEKVKLEEGSYQPTVSVSTKKLDDKAEITVKDNGNGISQKVVDKIFQPFFTTKPAGQGTGLGLSLSYDIIKAHGGEIKVETKAGEGSVFIITFPL